MRAGIVISSTSRYTTSCAAALVRLLEGRERYELLQRGQHRGVEADRLAVIEPAVHDAVPDGH